MDKIFSVGREYKSGTQENNFCLGFKTQDVISKFLLDLAFEMSFVSFRVLDLIVIGNENMNQVILP